MIAVSWALGSARAFPFPFVLVFDMGDGLPSDVGGEGDGVRGVPNRNCGVVFVEDDTTRDGDDNDSSARSRCEACWEDVAVVNGLPKGSSWDALGSGTVLDI